MVKILVIEDDESTADYVARGLRQHGHVVDRAANGRDGLILAASGEHDILIVDRMLPGIDGLALVRTLRETGVRTPVLFLTALGGVGDRVRGLDAGGDDYLVKPFAFAELLARVNALARRPPLAETQTVLCVGDLEMDLLKRSVTRAGKQIDLQPREFSLLEYLMRNAGRVVTRTMLNWYGSSISIQRQTSSRRISAACVPSLPGQTRPILSTPSAAPGM